MQVLRIDNYIIDTPLIDILNQLRLVLTNGKLKTIKAWQEGEDNIVVTCPNRNHQGGREHSPAMNIYVGNSTKIPYGFCKCWACDFQTSFIGFVAECFECSEDFAKHWLISKFGTLAGAKLILDDDIMIKPKKARVKFPADYLDQFQSWHPYLAKRKLSREVCELFKVKYDPVKSEVIFPCFDTAGNILMAPRRSIVMKRFNLERDVEKPVYCLDFIINNNIDTAIICEGMIDALTCYTYDYPAIATIGYPSPSQIEAINKSPIKQLYFGFDNDTAGKRMANTVKNGLSPRILTKDIILPKTVKDLNELSYEEFQNIMQKAKNTE